MALIEHYEERASTNIFGSNVKLPAPIPELPELIKERTSIWFNTVDMEKSIFSVAVSMTAQTTNEITSVKTQTDFSIYPYANFESIGGAQFGQFCKDDEQCQTGVHKENYRY